jgi:hypothetical protein
MAVPVAVRANRGIAVDASGQMRPMAGQHFAMTGFLKIENVQSLRRIRDEIGRCRGLGSRGAGANAARC